MWQKDLNIYNPTFQQIKASYENVGYYCKKHIYIYDYQKDRYFEQLCFKFHCQRCRKILKRMLFLRMLEVFKEKKFDNHYIITCEGEKYRENHSFIDSYYDMNKAWNKLRKIIDYWFVQKWGWDDKFSYIILPRAQNDGYCHFHLLSNINIYKLWLETKKEKYDEFGFVKIGKNRKPIDYLTYDFFKDSEYYVPDGVRHYNCSRDIKLGFRNYKEESDKIMYMYNRFKDSYDNLENFNDLVMKKYGRMLPFDAWLKYFHKKNF